MTDRGKNSGASLCQVGDSKHGGLDVGGSRQGYFIGTLTQLTKGDRFTFQDTHEILDE